MFCDISDFIKDIKRGKVIEVKSIMQKGSSKGASSDSSCSLEDALKVLNNEKNNECSVVDDKGKKIGKVTLDAAIGALFRERSSKNTEKYKTIIWEIFSTSKVGNFPKVSGKPQKIFEVKFSKKFDNFFSPGSITKLKLKIIQQATGTWVPLKTLSQSEQGIWTVYTINQDNQVVRDLVEIIYFEGEYAYVNGTLKNGDLIVLGGPSKIIEGKNLIN